MGSSSINQCHSYFSWNRNVSCDNIGVGIGFFLLHGKNMTLHSYGRAWTIICYIPCAFAFKTLISSLHTFPKVRLATLGTQRFTYPRRGYRSLRVFLLLFLPSEAPFLSLARHLSFLYKILLTLLPFFSISFSSCSAIYSFFMISLYVVYLEFLNFFLFLLSTLA